MKLPKGETPENHSNGDGYISDDYEQLEMPPAPIRDGDFSEYMWMENEEEFNSQVLRELEEQELMEECMAAMLGDSAPNEENESSSTDPPNNSRTSPSFNGLSESVNNLSLSSNGVRNNSSDSFNNSFSQSSSHTPNHYSAQNRLNRLRQTENSRSNTSNSATENGSKFTLNPDAKEFVPSSPRAAAISNQGDEKVPS